VPDLSRVNINLADEPLSAVINEHIERTTVAELPRSYLGVSALHECLRQTQFAWWCKPLLPARMRSIFARGHFFEARTREALIAAGFVFAPQETCEFVALNGLLQGHLDGIVVAKPPTPGAYLAVPCVWEHKAVNAKNFRAIARDGFARTFPRYAVQVALYQFFLNKLNPALISVANADDCALMHFTLPFDPKLAELWVERASEIIAATRKGELLPRAYGSPDDWRCKICEHRERCWGGGSASASP
jgi:hypothetical protein